MSKIIVKKDKTDRIKKEIEEVLGKALEEIGITAEAYAKLECPVDTGRLSNSITHIVEENTAYIGTNVEYGKFVELGTSKMDPQPYLRPAVTGHIAEYKNILEQELKSIDEF